MQNRKSRRDEQRGMVDKGSRRNQIYAKKARSRRCFLEGFEEKRFI